MAKIRENLSPRDFLEISTGKINISPSAPIKEFIDVRGVSDECEEAAFIGFTTPEPDIENSGDAKAYKGKSYVTCFPQKGTHPWQKGWFPSKQVVQSFEKPPIDEIQGTRLTFFLPLLWSLLGGYSWQLGEETDELVGTPKPKHGYLPNITVWAKKDLGTWIIMKMIHNIGFERIFIFSDYRLKSEGFVRPTGIEITSPVGANKVVFTRWLFKKPEDLPVAASMLLPSHLGRPYYEPEPEPQGALTKQ